MVTWTIDTDKCPAVVTTTADAAGANADEQLNLQFLDLLDGYENEMTLLNGGAAHAAIGHNTAAGHG